MAREHTLTDRQQRFVDEYPKDYCATRAAERAGYSARSAAVIGSRLKKNPRIAQEIEKHKADIVQETRLSVESLTQKRLWAVAEAERKGDLANLDRHLTALEKHIGFYEADNNQRADKTLLLTESQWQELMERRKALEARSQAIDATAGIAT
ncbi:MAG: terminase small subunit [Planctomycetota bacterium]|jgi:phage terminase small subunit